MPNGLDQELHRRIWYSDTYNSRTKPMASITSTNPTKVGFLK